MATSLRESNAHDMTYDEDVEGEDEDGVRVQVNMKFKVRMKREE